MNINGILSLEAGGNKYWLHRQPVLFPPNFMKTFEYLAACDPVSKGPCQYMTVSMVVFEAFVLLGAEGHIACCNRNHQSIAC